MRWVWMVIGVLATLFGILWTLQGLDLLGQDGGMNGNSTWAIIGPIVAVVGMLLFLFGARRRRAE
jgi:drug/metabolite transporter superfamily protein YnfA